MKNKLKQHTEKTIFDFEMTFEERLLALEQSYQNHRGDAWRGMTIQEFIKQALQERDAIIVEMLEKEKKIDKGYNPAKSPAQYDMGHDDAITEAIELIKGDR